MKELEQPPPGPDDLREEPPEGWRGISPRAFWAMVGVGVFVVLAVLLVFPPIFFRSAKPAARTAAISNVRQIGLALLEFDQEYGEFPSEATLLHVLKDTGSSLDFSGPSSNALFRQLIAFGVRSEAIFYCMHPEGVSEPDNVTGPGRALEAGEVGFSYISGLTTSMDPEIPVLLAPMKIGTEEFLGKNLGGKAVLLRLDNSVEAPYIRASDGKVLVGGGKTLFDTGTGTVWPKDFVIDLRHPAK